MRAPLAALAFLVALLAGALPARAQITTVDGGTTLESYSFGSGFGVESLHQLSVPLVVEGRIGSRSTLTLATGWTRIEMGLPAGESSTLAGAVDTEIRLSVTPGREGFRLFATGALPTGIATLGGEEVAVLGPLAHDLLAFSTPTLGGGGAVGFGVAGATAVGATAIGWATHLRFPFSYQPVLGSSQEVRAGNELRLRVGVETAVGERSALQVAGVASLRGKDRLRGRAVNGVGRRVAGHAAFATPLGQTVTTFWASGFYRSAPALESTAVGASVVPRGGFVAGGVRVRVGVGATAVLEPEVEFRSSSAAPAAAGAALESQGRTLRVGVQLLRPLTGRMGLTAAVGGRWGTLHEGVHPIDARGVQASVALRWSR